MKNTEQAEVASPQQEQRVNKAHSLMAICNEPNKEENCTWRDSSWTLLSCNDPNHSTNTTVILLLSDTVKVTALYKSLGNFHFTVLLLDFL